MNEITLSNNLAQIELEINHHKHIAGQSIWEIGRRLNHVKEHDLAHGQFGKWLDKVKISHSEARKMMTISKQLSNRSTLNDLGTSALYLIATLPVDEQAEQLNKIEQGEIPTVAELRHLKGKLSAAKQRIAELEKQSPQIQVKEVIKEVEVLPADYHEAISLNQQLMDSNKAHVDRNAFLEKQLQDLYSKRAEVDEKSAKYDELTEAIRQSQGQLDETQSKIGSYKNLLSFLRKGNEMLLHMGGLIYIDEERIINSDTQIRREFEQLQQSVNRLADDLNKMTQTDNEILEGEIL